MMRDRDTAGSKPADPCADVHPYGQSSCHFNNSGGGRSHSHPSDTTQEHRAAVGKDLAMGRGEYQCTAHNDADEQLKKAREKGRRGDREEPGRSGGRGSRSRAATATGAAR
jgi:hypothetical protein